MLRKKRFICLFLIIGLCLALVPAAVAAEDPADVSEAALPQEDTGLVFSEDSILGAVLDGAEAYKCTSQISIGNMCRGFIFGLAREL